MNLESIRIKNYRSIEELSFNISEIGDKSYTYGLIGENEAGKTSFLKAIAFKDKENKIKISAKDFFDKSHNIDFRLEYKLTDSERKKVIESLKLLIKDDNFDEKAYSNLIIEYCQNIDNIEPTCFLVFTDKLGDEDDVIFEKTDKVFEVISSKVHKTIFWSYDERFLISKEILLSSFFADPMNVSVPLTNCFLLADYKIEDFARLQKEIISDSTDREDIREKLGNAVTKHIKRVWKNHDIKISFDLTPEKINFHIKDAKSKGKAKTVEQRSDGFKQFVSFLLTISAQHKNSQLKNTILLLDEPETHLHPKAQEFFLEELIEISKSNDNIIFFATHSNYFIDKNFLERNFKVSKTGDSTKIEQFDDKLSTYASVNYDVFDIMSTDYHNELYSLAQDLSGIEETNKFDNKIKEIIKRTPKINYKHTNSRKFDCTLPTYIRHQIHHPENKLNSKYKESELEDSILILKEFIGLLKNTEEL